MLIENLISFFGFAPKKVDKSAPSYHERLTDIVLPVMKEVGYPYMKQTSLRFSQPIDPNMAFVRGDVVNVCPLFVLNLLDIPENIRPKGWEDPRLCDLNFLQKLSDWIATECNITKQKVTFVEAAAAKAIFKLKEDPHGLKAVRAGLAHELGHVVFRHSYDTSKASREKEKEADIYAATHLKDGLEGIKVGFSAWQKCLKAVRASSQFDWKTRLCMQLFISPGGNLIPLYLSHGFFETRIRQVEEALEQK